ncbi:MAG: hypothetical protein JW974_02395 [Alphaproteobacteria bacterium]|nr:hypothetical protein [Alphaproteobacteria bacterium]MBN2675268.1 hypothetical protein [Alphaproteobacteria bacterium]
MLSNIITGICCIASISGCAIQSHTGAEIRDQLNNSVETMIDWNCLGYWESKTLDYQDKLSDNYFHNENYNSYKLTNENSEKNGILLLRGEPYEKVYIKTVLSKTEAIIAFSEYDNKLYYFNTKSVKNISKLPEFYDGQIIPVNSNICMALDGTKTHSYQTALGIITVQNVTLIPRYMKNQFYKSTK